jgi:hypothetical protein
LIFVVVFLLFLTLRFAGCLYLICLSLHLQCAFSDPGIIPRKRHYKKKEDNPFRNPPMSKTVTLNGFVVFEFCSYCVCFEQPKVKRCSSNTATPATFFDLPEQFIVAFATIVSIDSIIIGEREKKGGEMVMFSACKKSRYLFVCFVSLFLCLTSFSVVAKSLDWELCWTAKLSNVSVDGANVCDYGSVYLLFAGGQNHRSGHQLTKFRTSSVLGSM